MSQTEKIVLVHGTAADKEGEPGHEKWWETKSIFARTLGAELWGRDRQEATAFVSFRWSGLNSEFSRRQAGFDLSRKLDELERQGISYHLIGHSHGGSVIWHSLLASAREGTPRPNLKTWTTVGTPFLSFVPRSRTFVVIVIAVLLASLCLLLPFLATAMNVGADLPLLLEAPLWAQLATLFGPLCVMAGIIWLSYLLLAHSQLLRQEAVSSLTMQRLEALCDRHIPLWHPLDEPISGLSASTGRPPEIAPRVPGNSSRRLFDLFPLTYNRTVAPLIDAVVWWVVSGKLQGRDIGGLVLSSCSALPPIVTERSNLMPLTLQHEISSVTDSLAKQSAKRLRVALREVGELKKPLATVAEAISWQEVVHTSYFDHAQFARVCGELIRQKDVGNFAQSPPRVR